MSNAIYTPSNKYINTSVDDARSTLECQLARDPLYVVLSCSHTLVELQGRIGHKARREMLAGMIRKALKDVPMDVTPLQPEVDEQPKEHKDESNS